MAVVVVFEGLSSEQYEESVVRLTGGRDRLESAADWPVGGLLAHIAGDSPRGFRVVDVWESEEAFGRFAETLGPIMEELGITGQPELYPAHTYVSG